MVLARYLIKRYVAYFCALTVLLALVFNLIEFFEKLMRASQASLASVGYFVFLNFSTSFIDLMPLGAWLATCLVLRDLIMREEWEILTLLGVRRVTVFNIIACATCFVMIISLVFDELILRDFAAKAEMYRQETFKGRRTDSVVDGWYKLNDTIFCRIGMLDFKNNVGSQLTFFYLSSTFSIEKIIEVQNFSFKDQSTDLVAIKGHMLNFQAEEIQDSGFNNSVLQAPLFLEKISDSRQPFSLGLFFKRYVLSQVLGAFLRSELWVLLIERIFFYIQLVVLSMTTLLVFFIFEENLFGRWLVMLLVYPLHMVAGACFRMLFNLGMGIMFFGLFYLFLFVIFAAVLYRSKRDFL